jgi:hypothetical protein
MHCVFHSWNALNVTNPAPKIKLVIVTVATISGQYYINNVVERKCFGNTCEAYLCFSNIQSITKMILTVSACKNMWPTIADIRAFVFSVSASLGAKNNTLMKCYLIPIWYKCRISKVRVILAHFPNEPSPWRLNPKIHHHIHKSPPPHVSHLIPILRRTRESVHFQGLYIS